MNREPLPKKARKARRGGALLEFNAPVKKLARFPIVFGLCVGSFCLAVLLKRTYFRSVETEELKDQYQAKFLEGEEEFRKARENSENYMRSQKNTDRIKIQ